MRVISCNCPSGLHRIGEPFGSAASVVINGVRRS